MKIDNNHVVTLNYTLTDNDGEIIDQALDSSFAYLHGANNIITGLEKELNDCEVGQKLNVKVPPAEGYGDRNEGLVEEVPREMFPDGQEIKPGMMFQAQGPSGETITVTVLDANDTVVKIDANHALAGIELNFDVEVMDIREAEAVEIEHGHVHGPGAHDH